MRIVHYWGRVLTYVACITAIVVSFAGALVDAQTRQDSGQPAQDLPEEPIRPGIGLLRPVVMQFPSGWGEYWYFEGEPIVIFVPSATLNGGIYKGEQNLPNVRRVVGVLQYFEKRFPYLRTRQLNTASPYWFTHHESNRLFNGILFVMEKEEEK
ncbi:MAG TPA: hypothetical protein VJB98_02055 [Candidatus Paceibacterota bacterium]